MASFLLKVVSVLLVGNFFVDAPTIPPLDIMMKILFGFKTYTGIAHVWPLLLPEPTDQVLPQFEDWASPALGCILYGLSYMALYYYWDYKDNIGCSFPSVIQGGQSIEMLPEKSVEAGQGFSVDLHVMELRSQCSGIHDSLMRGSFGTDMS